MAASPRPLDRAQTRRPASLPARLAALAIAVPALLVAVVGIVIQAQFTGPLDWSPVFIAVFAAVVVNLTLVGAIVAVRVPSNPVGWMMAGAGLAAAVAFYGSSYASFAHDVLHTELPLETAGAWLGSWLFGPTLGGLAVYLLLLFPTGRFGSRPARLAGLLGVVGLPLSAAGMALVPGPLSGAPWIENPVGIRGGEALLGVASQMGNLIAIPVFLVALWSFVAGFRRAGPVERQQRKWFGFVATGCIAALLASIVTTGATSDALWTVAIVGLAILPVSIGFAILRYRLWDIDRIVSRTLSWAALTAILAAVSGALVIVLQATLQPVTHGSTLIVAISTLVAAALFQPLRRRVQTVVDRRFDRTRVDGEAVAAAFSNRLRDQVALDAVLDDLGTALRNSVAPASSSVWIAPSRRR